MKFFIDTANIDEIKEANSLGILDGVTTNPTLIAKENRDFREILKDICKEVNGPISAEVISFNKEGMIKEARELAKIADNINIKVPITKEGLAATKKLKVEGIKTNITLIFSAPQALLAAKAGAAFVSPFVGRLDDISQPGMGLVEEILTIFQNYEFTTEVIVASIRNPLHVVHAATIGAHIATIPFKVIQQLLAHPLTNIGIDRFLQDWEKVPQK